VLGPPFLERDKLHRERREPPSFEATPGSLADDLLPTREGLAIEHDEIRVLELARDAERERAAPQPARVRGGAVTEGTQNVTTTGCPSTMSLTTSW